MGIGFRITESNGPLPNARPMPKPEPMPKLGGGGDVWQPCPCCKGLEEPEHALVHAHDSGSEAGDVYRVRVPYQHRHDPIGWGTRSRVRWSGDDGKERTGIEVSRGPDGVHVVDHEGGTHRLRHDSYTSWSPRDGDGPGGLPLPKFTPLLKASDYKALKPGQRWITAHPNGKGEKGVPILIQEHPDGTHRVIAGAGGKLTHLRLRNVKSPEEMAAAAQGREIDKRAAEKERKAGLTPEQREKEKGAKVAVQQAKTDAERTFIEKVRKGVGGISEDLDESKIKDLSEGAQALIKSRHHRQQLREALKAKDALAQKLVEHKVIEATADTLVADALEEDPVVGAEAENLAALELELSEKEAKERSEERIMGRGRIGGRGTSVGEAAAAAVQATIEKHPDVAADLAALGGRSDNPGGNAAPMDSASNEVDRRALEALDDARRLVAAAKSGDVDDPTTRKVVQKALERAGWDLDTPPAEAADLLQKEAARKLRRAEVQKARAKRLREIEAENPDKALGALAFSDLLTGIADSVSTAKKMGLIEASKTPLNEPEIAEIREIMQSAGDLREKTKAFREMTKAAEKGDYDKSRRAFDLDVTAAPDRVDLDVDDEVRRNLTEQLLGIANPKRMAHQQAVANGQYGALADVGLGIAGQRYLDRSVVDAIGVGNAAVLMRHAMEQDGHDTGTVLEALEKHHVKRVSELATRAIAQANTAVPGLSSTVEDVGDIEKAMTQLDAYEDDLDEAQRSVGSALGSLEATATLGQAFRQAQPDHVKIKAEGGNYETQLAWLHAAGLKPGDYTIEHGEKKTIVIPKSSFDKLTKRTPKEEIERRQAVEAIKKGEHDEDGWLPEGIVSRTKSSFTAPVPNAPRHYQPVDLRGAKDQWRGNLEDHVGSRLADGEQPHEVLTDLLAPQIVDTAPDTKAYLEHVRGLFPMVNEEGQNVKYEEHAAHFQGVADKFMTKKYGTETGSFHAQDLGVDDPNTHEAVFRTLAEDPMLSLAFKPSGTFSPQDHGAIREQFYRILASQDAAKAVGDQPPITDTKGRAEWAKKVAAAKETALKAPAEKKVTDAKYRASLQAIGPEPTKTAPSMFGGSANTREWVEWSAKRDAVHKRYPREGLEDAIGALGQEPAIGHPDRDKHLAKVEALKEAASKAPTPWGQYVEAHGSLELAQHAIQDEMRGRFVDRFREHHGKISGKGLRVGVQPITNQERHVAAIHPDTAEALKREAQAAYARLQNRSGGQFAGEAGEGGLKAKFTKMLEESTIAKQNQASMFSQASMFGGGSSAGPQIPPDKQASAKPGERLSLGDRAEAQLESLIGRVGGQFDPKGGATGLFPGLNMDGPRATQQRVIRMMDVNGGRVGGFLGTGAGKSLTSIGAFLHQKSQGKASHGLYLVPVAVQAQFGGEMLRYTEPGRFKWATGDGKSHEERVAMLKDHSVHMRVMTHASFRDTALRIMADHQKIPVDQMRAKLKESGVKERAQWMRAAFDHEGIPTHFVYNDEAHGATEREGADPSLWNRIATAASHPANATHYLHGTATPAKNDESEIYSTAAFLDPEKYADRAAFMGAFGSDVDKNPDALRRELAHLSYSARIDPEGVTRTDSDNPEIVDGRKVANGGAIKLEGEHLKRVEAVGKAYEKARKSRGSGGVDVEAMKELSPGRFEAAPEEEHAGIARELSKSLGIIRESAMRKAVNQTEPEHNLKLQRMTAAIKHDLDHGTWTDRAGAVQKGRPSVVFTDSKAEAEMITEHLKSQGVRAATYHGGLNSKERETIRRGFQPEGNAKAIHDVVVATSAAEAGVNMQRAKAIHHYDVPMTAKSHAQRSGRAYRQGQQGDVDIHNWYTDAGYEGNALRRLNRKHGLASVLETPMGSLDETGIAGHYQAALAQKHQGADTVEALAAK